MNQALNPTNKIENNEKYFDRLSLYVGAARVWGKK